MNAPAVIPLDEPAIMLAASAVATTEHLRDGRVDLFRTIEEISEVLVGLAERGSSRDPLITATQLLATTTLNWALARDELSDKQTGRQIALIEAWEAAALSLARLVRRLSLRN